MAQPHKGDRNKSPPPSIPRVKAEIIWRAKHVGLQTSDYVTGIAALAYDHVDLAGRLAQATFGDIPPLPEGPHGHTAGYIAPRFPSEVYGDIRREASDRDIPMGYVVDELCADHGNGPIAHHMNTRGIC